MSLQQEVTKKFRAIIYVDGFNLYYGCLKGSPYKWLDLSLLASKLLNENYEIVKICYFTAEVVDYKNDGVTTRQGFYLNALKTIPSLKVYLGKFKEREKTVYINPPEKILLDTGFGEKVVPKSIFKGKCFEEKGTDVNLATRLLIDLYEDKFDTALVLSNDTDYKSAIHQVRIKGKKIFVVNTKVGCEADLELRKVSTKSTRKITIDMLKDCQFPEMIGQIRKPKNWE